MRAYSISPFSGNDDFFSECGYEVDARFQIKQFRDQPSEQNMQL